MAKSIKNNVATTQDIQNKNASLQTRLNVLTKGVVCNEIELWLRIYDEGSQCYKKNNLLLLKNIFKLVEKFITFLYLAHQI